MAVSENIRLQVQHIAPPRIYGTTVSGDSRCAEITDRRYLHDVEALHEGDTVMLLEATCIEDEESRAPIIHARRLIVNPDYLIDISSLSACFTESGAHPMRYLIGMLSPKETTSPILLGNTANQFLDDSVNHAPEHPVSYNTSIKKAFTADALKFAVCPDINARFFSEARSQYTNIHNAVNKLRSHAQDRDAGEAMLEPSFICPTLGLQGRLDYLRQDLRLLVELKSGKADEYYSTPQGPKASHTAQMMLYREMLHINTGIPREEITGLLLYSRYPKFFTGERFPHIVDETLVLRNAIVRLMRDLAIEPDTSKLFEDLTPETFNTRPLTGKLWSNYLQPQLIHLLAPFHHTDSLAKAYTYRFLRFTAYEQYLSKVGRNERDHAQSHLWCKTDEEKLADGEIITSMHLESFIPDERCGYDTLTFTLPPLETTDIPNFRRGDMVLFYIKEDRYDSASTRQVHKGTLLHIDAHTLQVGLRQHQHSASIFPPTATYAVEHDVSDSIFGGLYRSLYTLLCAPQKRQELLLGITPPGTDTSQEVVGHYPGEDTNAIIRTVKQATDYALIVGVPGAGKTSIVLRSIVEEHYRHTEGDMLIMAYTNRAVDEICSALENIEGQPSYIRIGNEQSCDTRFVHRTLSRLTAPLANREEVRSLITDTRIIVGTVSTIATRPELFAAKHFALTIIDEASQILEPQLIGLLATIRDKFVLIGDHKQLPAISLQTDEEGRISDERLTSLGITNCKQSLFERMYYRLIGMGDTACIATLYRQGRMHPEVSSFANRHFYNGQLCPVPLPHQTSTLPYNTYNKASALQALIATHRTAFINCPVPKQEERFKTNSHEAQLCAMVVKNIIELYRTNGIPYDAHQTIGIISPFRGQGALIRNELSLLDMEEYTQHISIDTVERYQGSQRDIIIYCTTITSPSQMELIVEAIDPTSPMVNQPIDRKLNVALTRARMQLFVIGIPQVLDTDCNYRALINELPQYPHPTAEYCNQSSNNVPKNSGR